MNVEAYNLDSLRKIVRELQKENVMLKERLQKADIPFETSDPFVETVTENEKYDLDQGGRIEVKRNISDDDAKRFFAMFWGRTDVYAKRGKKGGYFPQCDNRWNDDLCPKQKGQRPICDDCNHKCWSKLELYQVKAHLVGKKDDGSDVIGVYPLLPDGTCRFLVFDFDNHEKGAEAIDFANTDNEWHEEVEALRKMCVSNGIEPLVERSRSGRGAHVWIIFRGPVPAAKAREFGFLLLDKGADSINLKSFHYYDRMYPSQDVASKIGNLVALPLQGQALKSGNSAFVDQNWNAFPDQWEYLLHQTQKLGIEDIDTFLMKWKKEIIDKRGMIENIQQIGRIKPWNRKSSFSKADVTGKLHLVLADGLYVDILNISPYMQNQIRSMAAFNNPEFYKKEKMGYSNYYNFSAIYLGSDIDGYIKVPRGIREQLIAECHRADIDVEIEDQRERGRPIRVSFKGKLYMQQELAAHNMLGNTDGVLSAATAFGKTVLCSYLISERKVNTLILLGSKDLQNQWVDELTGYLNIQEEPPVYETKTGRKKKRDSVIGVLNGSKNTMTGIIDVATVGSIYGKGQFNELLQTYGMVIMDECHHVAAPTSMAIMQKVNAKYVYGVTATPKRADDLNKVIYMMLGPLRHKYTAMERAEDQGIGHYVVPRFTRMVDIADSKRVVHKAYELIAKNEVRNQMIIDDVICCVQQGKTPLILTKYKEHARALAKMLGNSANHIFLLYGDNTDKENETIRENLKAIPNKESIILLATGSKAGEGFNFPRLDVLMLAAPISAEGLLEQYVGRLNRDYDGKEAVFVYDYIDSHLNMFKNMYNKRLKTYKEIGFTLWEGTIKEKQQVNAIYDSGNYLECFEQDLIEAEKRIVISSSRLRQKRIQRLLTVLKPVQEQGVRITVITMDPCEIKNGSEEVVRELIQSMDETGIDVICKTEVEEQFAVIDDKIVWHGGVNLLGKEDAWDNLMRIKNVDVAAELMEIGLK